MSRDFISPRLKVHGQHQGKQPLASLCSGQTVVLKVFGRFGCPFTRHDASQLSRQREQLATVGARLVGIGFERDWLGLKGFWDAELYVDPDRQVYRFFQLPRLTKIAALCCLLREETSKKLNTWLNHRASAPVAWKVGGRHRWRGRSADGWDVRSEPQGPHPVLPPPVQPWGAY